MNKKLIRSGALAGAAVLIPAVWPQEPVPAIRQGTFAVKMLAENGSIEPKPVAGVPYSAEQSTTTTQTLADGNRVVHTSASKVYRDAQGRTRVEHTLGNIGPLATAEQHTLVMINDPVSGSRWNLQPELHQAQKLPTPMIMAKGQNKFMAERAQTGMSQNMMYSSGGSATMAMITTSGPMMEPTPGAELKRNVEDLGDQIMESVQVHGTRTTVTIPAGTEGNEQPMQIVDERWYSPELQTNIKTVHRDPRMGETVFSVSNLSRANPDISLFQVPANYEVNEGMMIHKDMVRLPTPPNE